MSAVVPRDLRQVGPRTLGIIWEDGHHSIYKVRNLRLKCRCALCVDEWTQEKKLVDNEVPDDIRPKRIDPVGRYAFKFTWSDGHDTGLYTFEALRRVCECPACRKGR